MKIHLLMHFYIKSPSDSWAGALIGTNSSSVIFPRNLNSIIGYIWYEINGVSVTWTKIEFSTFFSNITSLQLSEEVQIGMNTCVPVRQQYHIENNERDRWNRYLIISAVNRVRLFFLTYRCNWTSTHVRTSKPPEKITQLSLTFKSSGRE